MNVLVSAAGRRVRLVQLFREAVSRLGLASKVYACDSSPLAAALYAADGRILVPPACDAEHIPFVQGLCADLDIGLIVSVNDAELEGYAEARDSFEKQGSTIAIPSVAAVRLTRDKRSTHAWFVKNGFPVPRRWNADPTDLLRVPYPVIVKPARGSAGIGVRLVRSPSELADALSTTVDPVIEEYLTGREFTVNVLASGDGGLVCAVPHLRLETRAGEVSKARTFRHEELGRLARRLVERLPGARGPLNFQGFLDASGRVRLTEINARFGGGYPVAHAAGARFPEWLLMERLGREIPIDFTSWSPDTVMLRYDMEIIARQVEPDRIEPMQEWSIDHAFFEST